MSPADGDFSLVSDQGPTNSQAEVQIVLGCASNFCSLHGLLALRVDGHEVLWSADTSRVMYTSRLQRGRHVIDMRWCFTAGIIEHAGWGHQCHGIAVLRHRVVFFVGNINDEELVTLSSSQWRDVIESRFSRILSP